MRRLLVTLVFGGVCAFPIAASASPITINSSFLGNCVSDGISGGVCPTDSSTVYGQRVLTATDGGASATTWLNWIDTGTGALFDFDFTHTRTGALDSYSESFESILTFTVGSQNTTYAISGAYQVVDVGAPGSVYSAARLSSSSGGTLMYDSSQSRNTSNESFTLGIPSDGDYANVSSGSLTGTLLAGQTYQFFFDNYIYAYPEADSGASAKGCVTLSIGGATGAGACGAATAVPDTGVSTGGLLALALGALAYAIHRG